MWKSITAFFASNWLTIRVVGTFVVLITVFFTLLTYTPIVKRVDLAGMLAQLSAWLSWGLLRVIGLIVGFRVQLDGTILGSGEFGVDVSPACSGAVPSIIYLAAVFAFPTGWRSRLIGSALGLGVILGVNLLRVVALFLIGLFFHEYFHETHVYIAQALVVAIAIATWLFWAGRFTDAPGH
jgi:exosortase/archaeosortase family protein